jgi:glycosyltransferase involved in cell wall biosynthesis
MQKVGMNVRVALIAPTINRKDGWSRVVENLASHLSKYVELALFLPIDSPRSSSDNLKIYYSLPPSSNLWDVDDYFVVKAHYRLKFLKKIVNFRPDIIQTIDTFPWLIDGGVASLVCNSPFFVGAHGTYAIKPLYRRLTKLIMVGFLSLAKEVHCISSFTTRVMKDYLPKWIKIKILHQPLSGVDYFFFAQKRDLNELKMIYNGWPVILTVGALKARKGIDLSLRAFKLVKQIYKEALYVIIGKGDINYYERYSHALGLKHVYFIPEVDDERLAQFYQLCDLYLMLPRSGPFGVEGLGLVYLEAAAASKPIVATSSGGVADVVKNGFNGILVPPEDYEAAAKAIIKILSDPKLAADMGMNGTKIAISYSWDNICYNLLRRWNYAIKY